MATAEPGPATAGRGAASLPLAPAGAGAGRRPIYSETLWPRLHYGWSELTSLMRGRCSSPGGA